MGRNAHPHARRHTTIWLIAGASVIVLTVLFAGWWNASPVSPAPAAPHFVSFEATDKQTAIGQRTVVVAQAGMTPTISGSDGHLMTTLLDCIAC